MVVSLLCLSGCVTKHHLATEMVGCEQFKPIELPKMEDWKLEPVGMLDVIDKNVSMAVMYRNLSKTGLGSHSYKNASIMDNNIVYAIYEYLGYLITEIEAHNIKAREEIARKELQKSKALNK